MGPCTGHGSGGTRISSAYNIRWQVSIPSFKCVTFGHVIHKLVQHRGLPLIMYASRGGGGVNTNAYKCVQGGRGGLSMTKNTHFVRRFIENATICGCCSIRIYNH